MGRIQSARARTAGDQEKHRRRRADHMRSAVRSFRKAPWTPEGLLDKIGRLAVRIVAAHTVILEKTGIRVLSPSLEAALQQLIHKDISRGRTASSQLSTSPPPSRSASGSGSKPTNR